MNDDNDGSTDGSTVGATAEGTTTEGTTTEGTTTEGTTRVLDIRVHPTTLAGALRAIDRLVADRRSAAVHLCNAWNAVLAGRDASYAATLNAGALNLPDGISVVWASRLLGAATRCERVTGAELLVAACEAGLGRGVRHYLYGGGPGVAQELAGRLSARLPGLRIVGAETPPYRPLTAAEAAALADRVTRSGADLVWVGLGTPKQDTFIARFKPLVQVGALLAVGAAFDFLSGRKPMAPTWMRRCGLEWAFRFVSEPRRLWRRYLIGNPTFTVRLVQQLARERRPRRRRLTA